MSIIESIPPQVYFLLALAAVLALLADTAVRSWRSPERVADPSVMWPRPAPARGELLHGPRLPSGRFTASPIVAVARRAAQLNTAARVPVVSSAGDTFWSMAALAPGDGDADWRGMRDALRAGAPARYAALDVETESPDEAPPAPVATPHRGATAEWSPVAEVAEVEAARLPLDDVDEWLAERLRAFEHDLLRIDCRTVWLDRGARQCTLADELDMFVAGSQQLHAYRELRIGNTSELSLAAMRRELQLV